MSFLAKICVFGVFLAIGHGFPTSHNLGENADEWYEGDMRFPSWIHPKNGIIGEFLRWPNATLVYNIDSTFDEVAVSKIHQAMDEISTKTCIKFKKRTDEIGFAQFVNGYPGTGCFAFIGRIGIVQPINLEPGCLRHGTIVHEIIHAIGFLHEQSRSDRDDYVEIVYENIEFGKEFNFWKFYDINYEMPYDYDSLMHYSKTSFSSNGQPTIIPKKEGVQIGQRSSMSPSDAIKINRMYKCPDF